MFSNRGLVGGLVMPIVKRGMPYKLDANLVPMKILSGNCHQL